MRSLPLLTFILSSSLFLPSAAAYLDPCTALGVSCPSSASSAANSSASSRVTGSAASNGMVTASSARSPAVPQLPFPASAAGQSSQQVPGVVQSASSSFIGTIGTVSSADSLPAVPVGSTQHGSAPDAIGHPASDLTGSGPATTAGVVALVIAGIITLFYASSLRASRE